MVPDTIWPAALSIFLGGGLQAYTAAYTFCFPSVRKGELMATRPMAFISYRRDDTRDWANLVSDTIRRQLGRDAVFLDTDSIRIGDAWNR
jgi:hypothetical protein